MDPDAALEELRRLLAQKYPDTEDMERIQLLFESLDEWLSKGSFLPKAWDKQAHFDSQGLLHGAAGYEIAKKNPLEWEARGNPDGFWVDYVTWKDWAEKGPTTVARMSFRRANCVKPLTHEELNG